MSGFKHGASRWSDNGLLILRVEQTNTPLPRFGSMVIRGGYMITRSSRIIAWIRSREACKGKPWCQDIGKAAEGTEGEG